MAGVIAGVALLAGLALSTSRSSLFRIREVEVAGTWRLTREAVVRASGLTPSTNALWFDPAVVERRLERDPWVARATVSRSLPWTVRIEVTERVPVAAIRRAAGFWLIAGDGTWLGEVRANPHLPGIVLPPRSADSAPAPNLAGAAKAIGALNPGLRSRVRSAVVAVDGTLVLHLAASVRIEYGDASQLGAKARAVASILRWARSEGLSARRVDVTAPEAPAASFAS